MLSSQKNFREPRFAPPHLLTCLNRPLACLSLGTTEEYKLLERMNLITKDKYAEMTEQASSLVNNMKALQEKCKYHSEFDLRSLLGKCLEFLANEGRKWI